MSTAHTAFSLVLALLLLATGGGKLAGLASSYGIRDSLALSARSWRAIGAFEVLVVVGLVIGLWERPVGVVAAIGAVALMLGAIATRIRVGGEQRNRGVLADAFVLVVAVVTAVTAFDLTVAQG